MSKTTEKLLSYTNLINYDITCPECGHEFNDVDYAENDPNYFYETECPKCEKEFEMMVEYWPSFTVRKIK